jgi:very-short-patch-repair endonuclease
MTFPERLLWSALRNRNLFGLKFRRQVPCGPYILDYYCAEHALCVELDGTSHLGRFEADQKRADYLREHQIRLIRVTNDDVLNHREAVLKHIARACGVDPSIGKPPETLTPALPLRGGGRSGLGISGWRGGRLFSLPLSGGGPG